LLQDVTTPTSDIAIDAQRRDFRLNAMYLELVPNGEKITVRIIDPLNGLDDIRNKLLRTPMDPVTTFDNDPRRLVRIIKMAHKLLTRMSQGKKQSFFPNPLSFKETQEGDFNLAPDLTEYLTNSDGSFENAVLKFEGMYPKRDPIQDDIEKVLNSPPQIYARIVKDLLQYPYMFRMWCCPRRDTLSTNKINNVCDIIIKLMHKDYRSNSQLDNLSYNSLVTMLITYLQYPKLHLTFDEIITKSKTQIKGFTNFFFISETKGILNSGWSPRKDPYKNISYIFDMIDMTLAAPNTQQWYCKLIEMHQKLSYNLLATMLRILDVANVETSNISEEMFENIKLVNNKFVEGIINKSIDPRCRREMYQIWSQELLKYRKITNTFD